MSTGSHESRSEWIGVDVTGEGFQYRTQVAPATRCESSTEEDEVITANIDLALGDTFREHVFNFAKHRRPEHYKLIVDRVGAGDPLPHNPGNFE